MIKLPTEEKESGWIYQDKNDDADVSINMRNGDFLVHDKTVDPVEHNHGNIDLDGNITMYHDFDRK